MEMHFEPKEVERYELKDGDILLNEGQSRELVGRPAMYRGELPGACFTNSLVRFQAAEVLERKFALELFRYWLKNGAFQSIAQITTNIAHLGAGRFADMDFPLPPLKEQRRIVAKLEALQGRSRRARSALDAVPPLLEKARQSILAAAFRGDLTKDWRAENRDVEPASVLLERIRDERRQKWEEAELARLDASGKALADQRWKAKYREPTPADSTGLPQLPGGWCWARAQELACDDPNAICAGPFGTIFKAKDFRNEGVPIIFLRHVSPGKYLTRKPGFMDRDRWEELFRPYSVFGGELLVTKLGEPPGACAIYPEGIGPAMVTPDVIKMQPEERLALPLYLMRYLNSELARSITFGVSYGTTRLRMTLELFREMPIPVAPIAEQSELVRQVERAFSRLDALEETMSSCRSELAGLDRALLSKAFSGNLVPQDPSDEPAEAMLERLRANSRSAPQGPSKTATRAKPRSRREGSAAT